MTPPSRTLPTGALIALWIIAAVAVLFFLRAASQLLIPIVIAVLISYALEPVVAWLERSRVPRLAGTFLVMTLLLTLGVWAGWSLRDEAVRAMDTLPEVAGRARELLGDTIADGSGMQDPGLAQRVMGSVLTFAGHTVSVFFLVFFLLLSGHHVRNRIVEIAGTGGSRRRTAAEIIDDINAQVQRFLLVNVFTSAVVGASTWLVLAWMGVDNAAVWGILAGVFNSIPYFGPVIISGGLFVVGLVQDGGTAQALRMAGAALAITSLEGWLLTPPLMGKAERMSVIAVFLGLLLWTWIWGAWGTILAVPMLVVIKSFADHIDALKPIGRLMAP